MDKLDFSDFNKFLSSVGLVLIGVSMVAPWLFFKEPFDLLLEVDKLAKLTPLAQSVVKAKQESVLLLLHFFPYISAGVFGLGVIVLIVGLRGWYARQSKIDDVKALLDIEKQKKELKQLDSKEIQAKAEVEVSRTEGVASLNNVERPEVIRNYLHAEQAVSARLNEIGLVDYEILTNYKVNKVYYDIILKSKKLFKYDYIVEVKYLRAFGVSIVENTISQMSDAVLNYSNMLNIIPVPVIILVMRDDYEGVDKVQEKVDKIKSSYPKPISTKWKFVVVKANDIGKMRFEFIE